VIVHFLMVLLPTNAEGSNILALLDGRPTTLFMLLAGISLTLIGQRRRSGADLGKVAMKRGLFLLTLGFANLILWPGDILRVYGVIFLISTFLLRRSTSFLLLISGVFIVGFMVLLFTFDFGQNWDWATLTYEGMWTWSGIVRNLLYDGFRSVFPWAGVLILGMAGGRLALSDSKMRRRAIMGGFAVWITAEAVSRAILSAAHSSDIVAGDPELLEAVSALFGTASLPPQTVFLASALGLATMVIGLCLSIPTSVADTRLARAIRATGQMAFTWYLFHIYFGVFVIVGLEWTVESQWAGLAVAGSYFAAISAGSLWWRSRGRRGPMESVTRLVTG